MATELPDDIETQGVRAKPEGSGDDECDPQRRLAFSGGTLDAMRGSEHATDCEWNGRPDARTPE